MSELQELELTITHPAGLHLRPAALFVRTAARFSSRLTISNLSREGSPEVDSKSMLGLMQIGVSQGHRVRLRASGPDAVAALAALKELVEQNFGDQP